MWTVKHFLGRDVHCYVGSLENFIDKKRGKWTVHCYVGSLEINPFSMFSLSVVHCHVGSLEIAKPLQI